MQLDIEETTSLLLLGEKLQEVVNRNQKNMTFIRVGISKDNKSITFITSFTAFKDFLIKQQITQFAVIKYTKQQTQQLHDIIGEEEQFLLEIVLQQKRQYIKQSPAKQNIQQLSQKYKVSDNYQEVYHQINTNASFSQLNKDIKHYITALVLSGVPLSYIIQNIQQLLKQMDCYGQQNDLYKAEMNVIPIYVPEYQYYNLQAELANSSDFSDFEF